MKLTFAEYAADARNCDIALWRPTNYWGRWIARVTNGDYCHVTGVIYWTEGRRWMSAGYEEHKGGFAEPLDVCAQRHPGVIDIYRVPDNVFEYCKTTRECVAKNLANLGWPYAWRMIRLMAGPIMPIMGLFTYREWYVELVKKVSDSRREGICSQHIARSFEDCGIRLLKTPSARVTPNDIARTYATDYVCTLI